MLAGRRPGVGARQCRWRDHRLARRHAAQHLRRQHQLQRRCAGRFPARDPAASGLPFGDTLMDDLPRWVKANRWCWSALAVLVLWLGLGASISRFGFDGISGIVASAAFLFIVACGQTLVVATGRGNIDLSGAGTITLAAFLVMRFADGSTPGLLLALVAV